MPASPKGSCLRLFKLTGAFVFLLFFSQVCFAKAAGQKAVVWLPIAKAANLKFSILLDKGEYKGQEPINATFKLENKGREPAWVNKRFYLNPIRNNHAGRDAAPLVRISNGVNSENVAKEHQGEVVLKVTSPSGKEIPCKFSYETGFPKSDYFELLEPAKEIASEYPRNLRGYFDFNEPGVYKVVAVYQNIFGKEIGLEVFGEKLISEPVSFKIIKE